VTAAHQPAALQSRELVRLGIAVELNLSAGPDDRGMQLRQHPPRFDMAFVRIEQALAEAAFQRRLQLA